MAFLISSRIGKRDLNGSSSNSSSMFMLRASIRLTDELFPDSAFAARADRSSFRDILVPPNCAIGSDEASKIMDCVEQSHFAHGISHLFLSVDTALKQRCLRDLDRENYSVERVSEEGLVLATEGLGTARSGGSVEIENDPPGRQTIRILGDLIAVEKCSLEIELGKPNGRQDEI